MSLPSAMRLELARKATSIKRAHVLTAAPRCTRVRYCTVRIITGVLLTGGCFFQVLGIVVLKEATK